MTALIKKLAFKTGVRIHVRSREFADRTLSVKLSTIRQLVNVCLDLRDLQRQY